MSSPDVLSKLDTLGAFREHTMEDRNAYYAQDICVPTPEDRAQYLARRQILNHVINDRNIATVLEVGCHDGFMTRHLINRPGVELVLGVDLNSNAIDAARQIRDEDFPDTNLLYVQQSVFDFLENNAKKFDLIVMTEFIEHFRIDEIFDLLRKLYRTLTPDGMLFISTPDINGRFGKGNPDKEHITLFDAALMEQVIDDVLEVPSDVFKSAESIFAVVERR